MSKREARQEFTKDERLVFQTGYDIATKSIEELEKELFVIEESI